MNLAQIRIAVRDILTAGSGQNTAFSEDTFWSDNEINYLIQAAQDHLWKVVRKARADYFTRILRTTDSALVINGQTFTPSNLAWVAGTGNYTMPPDFARMKLITDLSSDNCRISASDIAKAEFRTLLNTDGGQNTREYWYDILGIRTIVIRPTPQITKDLEFIYEKFLPRLRDWTTGTVSTVNGNTTMTFSASADIQNRLGVGDEIIVGTASLQATPDPTTIYPVVKTIDSSTQVTLEGPYLDTTISGAMYRASSVTEIPAAHHHLLTCYALHLAFGKGVNPSLDSAKFWKEQFDRELPHLKDDVEIRQGSDIETVSAYLEDNYDL